MEGFLKNFKFWAWYYFKTDALTTLMIVGIVAFTSFVDGGGFLEAFFTMLPLYLTMMVVMEVIVFGFTSITVMFPFAVGMGAKRDYCIIAKALLEHIILIINGAIAIVAFIYTKPEIKEMLPVAVPLLLMVMGILMIAGNLVSLFSNKFGRTAGMIVYIVFVILCVVGGMVLITSGIVGTFVQAMLYNMFSASVVLAFVTLLLDALSVYLLYLSVKNKDLNFSV